MIGVMDEVMVGLVAHTTEVDAGVVGLGERCDVMDVVVGGEVTGGFERLAVAAVDHHPARASRIDVIAEGAGPVPAVDSNAPRAAVADRAARHRAVFAVADLHGIAVTGLDGHAAQGDIARALHCDDRLQHRGGHLTVDIAQRGRDTLLLDWRPEVQNRLVAVQIPLAGRIKLLQQVLDEVAIPHLHLIAGVAAEGDLPLLAVHRLHADDAPAPVKAGVDADGGIFRVSPTLLHVRRVEELGLRRARHAQHIRPAALVRVLGVEVGVASHHLPRALVEKLAEDGLLQRGALQVCLQDLALPRLEARNRLGSGQQHRLARHRLPGNGELRRPGILRHQRQRLGQQIAPTAQVDHHRGLQPSGDELANFLTSARHGRKGCLLRSRSRIVALIGDEERSLLSLGACDDHQQSKHDKRGQVA